MRFCKYCGLQISDDAEFCQGCGKKVGAKSDTPIPQPMRNTTEPKVHFMKSNSKKVPVLIGTIAVIVLIVVCLVNSGKCESKGCSNKAISGMDYCYTHKCAVTSCDSKRYSLSNYCYSHYKVYDDDASTSYTPQVYSYELKISNIKLSSNSSYSIAEGTITNNSDQTVSYVKIKGSFKNSSGTVIDTDWTYAVGSEGLAPGESCTWRMSVKKDYSIKECSVSILDFDY